MKQIEVASSVKTGVVPSSDTISGSVTSKQHGCSQLCGVSGCHIADQCRDVRHPSIRRPQQNFSRLDQVMELRTLLRNVDVGRINKFRSSFLVYRSEYCLGMLLVMFMRGDDRIGETGLSTTAPKAGCQRPEKYRIVVILERHYRLSLIHMLRVFGKEPCANGVILVN